MVELSGSLFDVGVRDREKEKEREGGWWWAKKDRREWVSVLGDQSCFGSPALSL